MRLFVTILICIACCASASAQEKQTGRVRLIAPDLIAPPLADPSILERIRPRMPLNPALPTTPNDGDAAPSFRPTAIAAGRLAFGDRMVKLKAIRLVAPERICEARDGGTWPCGMHARTAFRLWLRGRAVQCDFSGDGTAEGDDETGSETQARCAVSGQDAGAWLVEQGWALAEDGGPYTELERQAQKARRGIFSGGPEAF